MKLLEHVPPLCPPKDATRVWGNQISLRALILFVTIIAIALGSLPLLKEAIKRRQYLETRYLVKTGEITEDDARTSFGDDYPAYRKFTDSLRD